MELSDDSLPFDAVFSDKNVVAEIMLKLPTTRSMVSCSAVSSTWLAAKKSPSFARRYAASHKPASLGFIVAFQQSESPLTSLNRLLFPLPSAGEDTAVALRQVVDAELLGEDKVLASTDGTVLTAGYEPDALPRNYYTSCPSKVPRVYSAVGPIMPRVPLNQGQHSKNTFGQFGVINTDIPSKMSFFIKDAAAIPVCTYAGVTFCSDEDIFVHVCVLTDGVWVRHVSPAIITHDAALFHRNPYSVLDGDRLYMMYVVGYIVCFNLGTSSFSIISLPGDLVVKARSWYDYTVVHHPNGGIALVHYCHGKLDTWLISKFNGAPSWKLHSSMDLVENFVPKIPLPIWAKLFSTEAFPLGDDHFFSLQVRSATPNARFVLITLGFDPGLYIVDMDNNKVGQISRADGDGQIGHVFPLSEPWPPKVFDKDSDIVNAQC